jgi:hypothetical protein
MLANSHPIPQATITLTEEELHAHIIGCIRTYDMMRSPAGTKKLVMPFMMGGKPSVIKRPSASRLAPL